MTLFRADGKKQVTGYRYDVEARVLEGDAEAVSKLAVAFVRFSMSGAEAIESREFMTFMMDFTAGEEPLPSYLKARSFAAKHVALQLKAIAEKLEAAAEEDSQ